MSGTGNRADVGSGFRAGARARADAAPGAGAGVWARESGVAQNTGFADVILKRLSVFHRVCTDLQKTHGILFHSVGTQS